MNYSQDIVNRFWNNVNFPDNLEHDCWIWTGGTNEFGYGLFIIKRKKMKSHRFSFEYYNGPILNNLHILHRCDNPPCINPNHLFSGTNADNMKDMASKGRSCIGSKNNTNLTECDVEEMLLDIYNHKYKIIADVSNYYGTCNTVIKNILHGRTWKHVTKNFKIPLNEISPILLHSRDNSGFNNPKSKLSLENIIEIKTRLKNGETCINIYNNMEGINVSLGTLYHIKNGNTWSHITI